MEGYKTVNPTDRIIGRIFTSVYKLAERCLIFALKLLAPLFQLLDSFFQLLNSFFLCRKNRCNHCNYKCTSGSRNKMPLTEVKEHPPAEKYKYQAQYQSYCIGFYKFHFHIPPSQISICLILFLNRLYRKSVEKSTACAKTDRIYCVRAGLVSIINQLKLHNLLCLRLASVYLPHPFRLAAGFRSLGDTVLRTPAERLGRDFCRKREGNGLKCTGRRLKFRADCATIARTTRRRGRGCQGQRRAIALPGQKDVHRI